MRRRMTLALSLAALAVQACSSHDPQPPDPSRWDAEAPLPVGRPNINGAQRAADLVAGAVQAAELQGPTLPTAASSSVAQPSPPTPAPAETPPATTSPPPSMEASAATTEVTPSGGGGGGSGQTTTVSWYGAESGSRTANGDPFDGSSITFAHKTMPFGTLVRFCGEYTCVIARCNDRGPFVAGRSFDLSRAAFAQIAPLGAGVATVTWELVG